MKRKCGFIKVLPVLFVLASCQAGQNNTVDFSDTKIKNFSALQTVGLASKQGGSATKGKKQKPRIRNRNIDPVFSENKAASSKNPFHIVGNYGDGLGDLSFLDKNDGQAEGSYSISEYSDFGNFAAFRTENPDYKDPDGLHHCLSNSVEWVSNNNAVVLESCNGAISPYYLLSKKTGNIYLLDNRIVGQYGDKFFCFGGVSETGDVSEKAKGFIGHLEEVDGKIKIQSFVDIKTIGGLDGEEIYRFNCDRWGNFLLKGHLYNENVVRLKVDASALFFDRLSQVYTTKDAKQYVNAKGELAPREVSIDQLHGEVDHWVSGTDVSRVIEELSNEDAGYSTLLSASETDKYYYHVKYGIFHVKFLGEGKINYSIDGRSLSPKSNLILRGDQLYYLDEDGIQNLNFKTGETKTVPLPEEYIVTEFIEDEAGCMKLSGYDASLKPFEAYIQEDGTISFERIEPAYVVILISPINR